MKHANIEFSAFYATLMCFMVTENDHEAHLLLFASIKPDYCAGRADEQEDEEDRTYA